MGYDLKLLRRKDSQREARWFRLDVDRMACCRRLMVDLEMAAAEYDDSPIDDLRRAARDAYVAREGHPPQSEIDLLNSPGGSDSLMWRPPLPGATSKDEFLPGIALHKLRSNDIWWVTAAECSEALAAWRTAVAASVAPGVQLTEKDERRLVAQLICEAGEIDDEAIGAMDSVAEAPDMTVGPRSVDEIDESSVAFWFRWLEFLETAADEEGFDVW